MTFDKNTMYRLTELDKGLVIGPADMVLPSKTAEPLVICHLPEMMEYLSRYLWERSEGKARKEAHELALKHASITHMRTKEVVL